MEIQTRTHNTGGRVQHERDVVEAKLAPILMSGRTSGAESGKLIGQLTGVGI